MAINTDTSFEVADLKRKLATARAQLSYEQKCTEVRLLEASEDQRLLRVQLLHIEPEYNLLLTNFENHSKYASELEEALEAMSKRLTWTENSAAKYQTRSKELGEELRASAAQNKELEKKLQSKLLSEGTVQGALAAELEETKSRYTTISQENTKLKNEHLKLRQANATLSDKLQTREKEIKSANEAYEECQDRIAEMDKSHEAKVEELKADIKSIKNKTTTQHRHDTEALKEELATIPPLKTEIITLKEKLQDHVDRLAKALTAKAALEAALESELAALRLELDDAHSAIKRAADDAARAATKQAASERQLLEKELATLRLELDDAQKIVERQSGAKDPKDSKAELKALTASLKRETKLREKAEKSLVHITEINESLQTKLAALKSAPTVTRVPLNDDNLKKRRMQPLTMEELEHSAKRVRKKGPKTSEFSITPFLKKQAAVTTGSPATPSTEPRGASVDPTIPEDDIAERSIMVPAVVESKEPTRILLAGAARKRKTAKADLIPEEAEEPTIDPASPEPELVPSRPKSKPRVGKKAAVVEKPKPQPSVFDSPSAFSAPAQKSKARKKMAPVEKMVYSRGIKPTVFNEDDGTGELVMNNGDSQGATAGPNRKVGVKGGMAGRLEKSGDAGFMLAPVASAFNKDISPSKKRPDALRRLFVGK